MPPRAVPSAALAAVLALPVVLAGQRGHRSPRSPTRHRQARHDRRSGGATTSCAAWAERQAAPPASTAGPGATCCRAGSAATCSSVRLAVTSAESGTRRPLSGGAQARDGHWGPRRAAGPRAPAVPCSDADDPGRMSAPDAARAEHEVEPVAAWGDRLSVTVRAPLAGVPRGHPGGDAGGERADRPGHPGGPREPERPDHPPATSAGTDPRGARQPVVRSDDERAAVVDGQRDKTGGLADDHDRGRAGAAQAVRRAPGRRASRERGPPGRPAPTPGRARCRPARPEWRSVQVVQPSQGTTGLGGARRIGEKAVVEEFWCRLRPTRAAG